MIVLNWKIRPTNCFSLERLVRRVRRVNTGGWDETKPVSVFWWLNMYRGACFPMISIMFLMFL